MQHATKAVSNYIPSQSTSNAPPYVNWLNERSIQFGFSHLQCGRNQCGLNANLMRIQCPVKTGLNSLGAVADCLKPHLSTMQEQGPLEGLHPNAPLDPLPQQSVTECLHLNALQSTVPEEGLAEDLAPDVPLSAVGPVKDSQAGTSTSAVLKQDDVESRGQ